MRKCIRLWAAIAAVCFVTSFTQAQLQPATSNYKEKVLYAFTGKSDGWIPGQLVRDAKGNLYGTNDWGGSMSGKCGTLGTGCGTVFKLSAAGKFSVFHTFKFSDGANPSANLFLDASGNIYGTAVNGGDITNCNTGCGVIFKLTPTGKLTVLYRFVNPGSDGANPNSVIMDANGNWYGTTNVGSFGPYGEVFELTSAGKLEVLYSFNGTDGNGPNGLIRDSKGNLYGDTYSGGDMSCSIGVGEGCGLVYKLDKDGTETILYRFKGDSDGAFPYSPLLMNKTGNLYGTAQMGGDKKGYCNATDEPPGCGTVFRINSAGDFSVFFTFNSADGNDPNQLMQDTHGNFYSTTAIGGDGNCQYDNGAVGCGTVFKLTAGGKESVLYNFKRRSDGGNPYAGVIEDSKGNLYGTTIYGGDLSCKPGDGIGCGVIFEITAD